YALMQAYDAVAQEADVQVGGQDQLFNILVAGRKLQTGLGQKPQIAIIMGESLPGTDGEIKMSKSLGNHIPLLSEPWDMFGKIMSLPDKAMGIYHKLIMGWTQAQVEDLEARLRAGELHPKDTKMKLAHEIVSIFHSLSEADAAQSRWNEVFRGGGGIPDDIQEAELQAEAEIRDILLRLKMVNSRGEARRLIQQNGVRLNEKKVESLQATVTLEMLPAVLQVGKRQFIRLVKSNGGGE
ncbi:MAG: tyrosine--tRNA ligase, partial [Chloroflexi bacterium]|nr:tyrosine--tRNA ligase [Chloroflexota bacterium]